MIFAASPGKRWIGALLLLLLCDPVARVNSQDENVPLGQRDEARTEGKLFVAYIWPDDGIIDDDFVDAFEKVLDRVRDDLDFKYIIFRLNSRGTPDGTMDAAERLAQRIVDLKRFLTIAYIDNGHQASNGAALIALACRKLVMGKTARIGYADDDETAIRDREEANARRARTLFAFYAAKRKKRYPPALAEALISRYHSDVYRVVYDGKDGNKTTEYLTDEEIQERRRDPVKRALEREKELIVGRGDRRLELDAARAHEYGLADVMVQKSYDEDGRLDALIKLSILTPDEDVIDERRGGPLEPKWEGGQRVIGLLNSPFVRFLLLSLAFLCLVLEFKLPGTFLFIGTSAICFLLFFLGGYFQNTASPLEIVLFAVGAGLVVTELFVMPGVMIFALLGVVIMLASCILAMVGESTSHGEVGDQIMEALTLLALSLGAGFGTFFLALRFLPHSSFFNRSGIVTHASIRGIPTADNVIEEQERSATLIGKSGVALTPLRPSGKVELEGQILDVVAEGSFIEAGEKVRIIEASGFRAVVERVD